MLTQRFKTNLNCGRCVATVKPHLDDDPAIERWEVDTANPDKILTVVGDRASADEVARRVAGAGFRVLGPVEAAPASSTPAVPVAEPAAGFWRTYAPLLLIVGYLVGVVGLVEVSLGGFDGMRSMRHFMAGFFLTFSFFKLLNLRGFVEAYQTYDVVARPLRPYGYAYPFVELLLGVAYLLNLLPVVTNVVTLVVMLVGIVGVSQALLQRRQIQCACLGTVFNLPMSKVTFVEDALMAAMAVAMLVFEAGM